MAFAFLTELKNKSLWADLAFYAAWFFLAVLVASYAMFFAKAYLRQQEIGVVDKKIAVYGSSEQRAYEKKIFEYKKKIDDFAGILGNHTISSQVFAFIERVTLPNVWFSTFAMSENDGKLVLSGETETMEMLSRQIDTFEKSKEYVIGANVLNSQVTPAGKIIFTLNLSLDQKIFDYQ